MTVSTRSRLTPSKCKDLSYGHLVVAVLIWYAILGAVPVLYHRKFANGKGPFVSQHRRPWSRERIFLESGEEDAVGEKR